MKKPFILVVEDDERLRGIIARNLQARGYFVLEAATFREAVDRMSIKPNLIVLDISLPDASGWDVAEWLESQVTPIPIIIMSGVTEPTQKQWQHFHPKAFLPKPFNIEQLFGLVEEYAPAAANSPR